MQNQSRQLAAILFTDIVGYTAMMQQDEGKALMIVKRYIRVIQNAVSEFSGRILNDYGDGSLCSFGSVTQAVRCAVEIQKQLQSDPVVPLRIGLHVGELFFEGEKVLGDGVNVASRVQSLGQPNTVLFSKDIYDKIKNQQEFKSISLGKFDFKNVDEPMEVFALANDGLIIPNREKMEGKLKEIQKSSERKKWMIAAGIIFLLATSLLAYRMLSNNSSTSEKTIAVLPFENLGVDSSEDYISDGITQDIIKNLSRISSLQKVIAWFSVRGFKNSKKSIKEVANELEVAAILTGTIERKAENIHIITELIDVNTNKRLWGDDFNYKSKDIISIQTNVATQIVAALKASLTPEEKKNLTKHYTENQEAYKLYIKGRFFWTKRNKESFDSAEVYYKKAIDLDPNYALAYSGLADLYALNEKGLSTIQALPIAKAYLSKALSLDSTLGEAWTTAGFIKSHFEYDWNGGKRILEKAIRLSPNYPTAHLYYGNIFIFNGDKSGLKEVEKALELDPLSISINWSLGNRYYCTRQYDLAITQLQKTLFINPGYTPAKDFIGLCLIRKKSYKQAIALINELPNTAVEKGVLLSYAYSMSGDKLKAKVELDEALKSKNNIPPRWLFMAYIGLQTYDEALTQVEKLYESRDIFTVGLKVIPDFDPMRNEPRFKALLKKAHFE